MDNKFSTLLIIVLSSFIWTVDMYCQEAHWIATSMYEESGNYSEAMRVYKQLAKEHSGTDLYLDDIAGIARCYSFTNENDSTLYYSEYAIELG